MAIALVQSATQVNTAGFGSGNPSITISGTTGGNALVAFASIIDDTGTTFTITSVTDGANSFTVREGTAADASRRVRTATAYAVNITGGDRTISFNLSGASNTYFVLGCLEFSGVKTSSPEDTFDANDNIDTSGGTDASAGPINTADAGDLLAGSVGIVNIGDSNFNFASPASWTNSYRQNDASSFTAMDAGYWLPGSTQASYTALWSHDNNANDESGAVVVALLPEGGGGGGGTTSNVRVAG